MKFALENWYFDHEVVRRYPNKEPIQYGGMPLLTRTGLKQIMAVETACEYVSCPLPGLYQHTWDNVWVFEFGSANDSIFPNNRPERAFRGLNLAMKYYGVWLEMGPLPRDMLLPTSPPQVDARIKDANIRSQRAAAERVEAVRIQGRIAAQGRQAALELISDNRYVHHYYHY